MGPVPATHSTIPRSGERACKAVGRCRYSGCQGGGSWSALAARLLSMVVQQYVPRVWS